VPELKRVEQHSHLSVRRRGCGEARIFGLMSRGWTEAKSITVKLQKEDDLHRSHPWMDDDLAGSSHCVATPFARPSADANGREAGRPAAIETLSAPVFRFGARSVLHHSPLCLCLFE
jgi:hypothetical protein